MSLADHIESLRKLSAEMEMDGLTIISSIAEETARALEDISARLEKLEEKP